MEAARERKSVPGMLVVFMIGQSCVDLNASQVVETKPARSAPSYPDVIPKQRVIRVVQRTVETIDVSFTIKVYPPTTLLVETSVQLDDILGAPSLELKRRLLDECRLLLADFSCVREFDEEYSVYCISGYTGDPEVYLSLYGDTIAAFLKNESSPLDEEEVRTTLGACLKYGKDDITIVDWDGAFIFDAEGDFQSNIELFEIANLQLLKSRILNDELDGRLKKSLRMLQTPQGLPLLRSREIRRVLREIIAIRTQSILESESVEHNIKLIGDWYSARLYALISKKFHLEEWTTDIKEKLQTLEDIYIMASENFSISYRATIEFVILAGWFVLLLLYIGEFFLVMK